MPRFLPLIALVVVALGNHLNAATAKDIQGRWSVDVDAMWEQAKKDIPAEQHEMAKAMIVPMLGQMVFEIGADAVTMHGPGGQKEQGTYKVTKIEGDNLTLETTKGEKTETMVVAVKSSGLVLTNPEQPGKSITLRRAPAGAAPAPADKAAPATP